MPSLVSTQRSPSAGAVGVEPSVAVGSLVLTVADTVRKVVAAGLDDATAKRFASAFSKGVTPTATAQAKVKLRGRVAKTVTVKLYDHATFAARLAVYRPKNPVAAAVFAALAA